MERKRFSTDRRPPAHRLGQSPSALLLLLERLLRWTARHRHSPQPQRQWKVEALVLATDAAEGRGTCLSHGCSGRSSQRAALHPLAVQTRRHSDRLRHRLLLGPQPRRVRLRCSRGRRFLLRGGGRRRRRCHPARRRRRRLPSPAVSARPRGRLSTRTNKCWEASSSLPFVDISLPFLDYSLPSVGISLPFLGIGSERPAMCTVLHTMGTPCQNLMWQVRMECRVVSPRQLRKRRSSRSLVRACECDGGRIKQPTCVSANFVGQMNTHHHACMREQEHTLTKIGGLRFIPFDPLAAACGTHVFANTQHVFTKQRIQRHAQQLPAPCSRGK